MGRITIFTMGNSPNCIQAKSELKCRKIPFVEISLTKHPHKRKDMISLTGKLTVPQLFINGAYVGGLGSIVSLLKGWEKHGKSPLKTYKSLVASGNDPQDPRLAPSKLPPISPIPVPPRDKEVIAIPFCSPTEHAPSHLSVFEVTELLKRIIQRRDMNYNLTTYKKAFRGSEFVDALEDHFLISREEAVVFSEHLHKDHNIFHHVVEEHNFADTRSLYFRLHCDQTPEILNSYRVWTERVNPDPISLLRHLKKQLAKILKEHINSEGKVNYKKASHHKDFPAFEEAVCELQGIKYGEMDHDAKLAFSINLYNFMIKYAFIKVGIGSTSLGRNAFFNTVSFNIGGNLLTFQDLEHGVLRGNRKAPNGITKPFGSHDDRLGLVFPNVDIRIHFALNCGTLSSPQIQDFTCYGVQEELRVAAHEFCADDKNVSIQGNIVHLSKIFSWYSEDFGSNTTECLRTIQSFCRGSKAVKLKSLLDEGGVKVKYSTYDWSVDASDFMTFTADNVKADSSRFS
jgi:glutaredoxin